MEQPVKLSHDGGGMSGQVKGWCPGARRPMESGDGLVVRVRPHAGRLTVDQALRLADLAETFGNGLIDLGSRAHLQIRGVDGQHLSQVHAALSDMNLLDPDSQTEARRNILTTPLWQDGDDTLAIVAGLEAALATGPDLPAKFGFAVDTGPNAVLGDASADIRIERAEQGLILRADGLAMGEVVTPLTAITRAVELARWFADQPGARRMAGLVQAGILPPHRADIAAKTAPALRPKASGVGLCVALPFGQMTAAVLRHLAIAPLRLTPWRSVVLEGVITLAPHPGLITDADDPLLRVIACTGAPGCSSASVDTRTLARALAPHVPPGKTLHVSGCAKGCACQKTADVVLTGHDGAFDLALGALPGATPAMRDLAPDALPDLIRGCFAP